METLLDMELALVLDGPALRALSLGQKARLCYKLADLYPWQNLAGLSLDAKQALVDALHAIPAPDAALALLDSDA